MVREIQKDTGWEEVGDIGTAFDESAVMNEDQVTEVLEQHKELTDSLNADSMDEETESESEEETVVPYTVPRNANVKLLPSQKDKGLQKGTYVVGRSKFELPSTEGQLAGFYLDNAGEFIGQHSQYGFIQEKGTPMAKNVTRI